MKKNKRKIKKTILNNIKKINIKNQKVLLKTIILFIIVIIIILAIVSIFSLGNNKNIFPEPTKERAKELLNNSYIYYVLSSGNVPLNGSELFLDDDKYYGIDIEVHSLKEIDNILKDTFSKITYNTLYDNVYGDPEKLFAEERNHIYISKVTPDEECKDIKIDGTIDIYERKGRYYIKYSTKDNLSSSEREIVYENSKWVLIDPLTVCFSNKEKK